MPNEPVSISKLASRFTDKVMGEYTAIKSDYPDAVVSLYFKRGDVMASIIPPEGYQCACVIPETNTRSEVCGTIWFSEILEPGVWYVP